MYWQKYKIAHICVIFSIINNLYLSKIFLQKDSHIKSATTIQNQDLTNNLIIKEDKKMKQTRRDLQEGFFSKNQTSRILYARQKQQQQSNYQHSNINFNKSCSPPYYNLSDIQPQYHQQPNNLIHSNSKFDSVILGKSRIKQEVQKIVHQVTQLRQIVPQKVQQQFQFNIEIKNKSSHIHDNKLYIVGETSNYSIWAKEWREGVQQQDGKIQQNRLSNNQMRELQRKLQQLASVQSHQSLIVSLSKATKLSSQTQTNIPSQTQTNIPTFNSIVVPVYHLAQKRWSSQAFRIKNFQSLVLSHNFLNPQRQKDYMKSLSNSFIYASQMSTLMSIKKVQFSGQEKSILFLPNQLTSMSSCIDNDHPNLMYLSRGMAMKRLQYSDKLWKMDFLAKTVQLLQQKGQIPQQRQNSTLFHYNTFWLILYGGYNLRDCQVYNDFYAYNILNQTWHQMSGDFEYLINARIHYSMTFNPATKLVYMFGGMLHDYQGKQIILKDMYQFKILNLQFADRKNKEGKRQKGKIQARTILLKENTKWPLPRMGHRTVCLNQSLILMIGGQFVGQSRQIDKEQHEFPQIHRNQSSYFYNDLWLFNMKNEQWAQILPWSHNFMQNGRANFILQFFNIKPNSKYELIIFGGDNNNRNARQTKNSDINTGFEGESSSQSVNKVLRLDISIKEYEQQKIANKAYLISNLTKNVSCNFGCQTCRINQQRSQTSFPLSIPSSIFPCQLIDSYIISGLPFAFSAFGLLTSLSVQKQSTKMSIEYTQYISRSIRLQSENFIQIEDDSYLPYTVEQIQDTIMGFNVHDSLEINGVADKKYKSAHMKQRNIVQFCNQLKIAALRLGQELLWMTINHANQIMFYWLRKQRLNQIDNSPSNTTPSNSTTYSQNINYCHRDSKQNLTSSSKLYPQLQQYTYRSYFFAVDYTNPQQLLPQFTQQTRQQVLKYNQQAIKQFIKEKKYAGSVIRISQLRQVNTQNSNKSSQQGVIGQSKKYELRPCASMNTILMSEAKQSNKFSNEQKLRIQESIDYNLRPYLSMLYLNRYTKMFLKVKSVCTETKSLNNGLSVGNRWMQSSKQVAQVKQLKQMKQLNQAKQIRQVRQSTNICVKQSQSVSAPTNILSSNTLSAAKPSKFVQKVQQYIQMHSSGINGSKAANPLIIGSEMSIKETKQPNQAILKSSFKQQKQKGQEKSFKKSLSQQQKPIVQTLNTNPLAEQLFGYPKQKPSHNINTTPLLHYLNDLTYSVVPITNRFEQIQPQFMLPKIDSLVQKQKIIEVDSEVFGDFDCKIVEVYYMMHQDIESQGEEKINRKTVESKENDTGKPSKDHRMIIKQGGDQKDKFLAIDLEQNCVNGINKQDKTRADLLFPNGLLIYHRNRLIQRYKYALGMTFSDSQSKHQQPKHLPKSPADVQAYLHSSHRFRFNLFGVIEIPDKFVQNVFGNGFMNQSILEKLYERVEHVSVLFEKMHGRYSQARKSREGEISREGKRTRQQLNIADMQVDQEVFNKMGNKKVKANQLIYTGKMSAGQIQNLN